MGQPDTTPEDLEKRFPKLSPADEAKTLERCKAQLLRLGWVHPHFMPAVARVEVRLDYHTTTASVDLRGVIRINPYFAGITAPTTPRQSKGNAATSIDDLWAGLTDEHLRGVLAHELMHPLLLHADRRGHRKPVKWNCATDRALNAVLRAAGIALPASALYPHSPAQEDWTAEQLYEVEPDRPEDDQAGFDPGSMPAAAGCGTLPNNNPVNDPNDPNSSKTDAQLKREWQEAAAQCKAQQPGNQAGNMFARLLEPPPSRVRWHQVLRGALTRALAGAGRDDVSWSRRSRRSMPDGPVFPGGVTYRCRVTVVIDTSGSMSDDDLAQAVAETTAIVNHTRVAVFLVTHDYTVQSVGWIKPGARAPEIQKHLRGRGGTAFDDAYNRVAEESRATGKFAAMVHLTDGEVGGWPDPVGVKRLVVALLGNKCKSSVPTHATVVETDL